MDDQEIRRGGFSYTIDTVRDYAARFPEAQLFYLIGADHIAQLPKWRSSAERARLRHPDFGFKPWRDFPWGFPPRKFASASKPANPSSCSCPPSWPRPSAPTGYTNHRGEEWWG